MAVLGARNSPTGSLGPPRSIVPLNYTDYGIYGDLIMKYPKLHYSIYLRGTILLNPK